MDGSTKYEGITRRDLGAMLLIDGAALLILIVGSIAWAMLSGQEDQAAIALLGFGRWAGFAMAIGPIYVAMMKLEGEVDDGA